MIKDIVLSGSRVVTPDGVRPGSLLIRDGMIAEIGSPSAAPGVVDCGEDYVAPGLIELHTDNIERHMTPRPHVAWPHEAAIMAHDAELAGAGITTVYDALRVGSPRGVRVYKPYARPLASEILALRAEGLLKISHFLHLRAEICSETLTEELAEFGPEDRVGILSLMDHLPGQRQFADVGKYRDYMTGKHGMSDDQFEAHVAHLEGVHERFGAEHEEAAVAASRRLGATLASHDDTTVAQVEVSARHGARIAEFPTTMAAAAACRARGVAVMMGAPNLVRGGSHSGNVAAADLVSAGLLDILSSDYVPAALLLGAVRLGRMLGDLAAGLDAVTRAPAEAAGLKDRGRLAPGLRADLIRLHERDGRAALRGVWVKGERVA